MKHSAKNFKPKLGNYGLDKWDVDDWAKCYRQFCWYAEDIFKNFRYSTISFDEKAIYFKYNTGEAIINIEQYHRDILLPAIEEICNKYGKQLTNLNPYFLPLTA